MEVRVRIPGPLRELVGGAATVDVDIPADDATVAQVLDALAAQHPALERRVRDERGRRRAHVNLFVGADNIRDLDDLSSVVVHGAEVSIIPAISGG